MINGDTLFFFDGKPHALELYTALAERICAELPDTGIKVQKSMITFANKHGFAFASHPKRKAEGDGKDYLIVSFGLDHSLASPRLIASAEPYPNRWTHHAAVFVPEDIDAELMGWIREAYDFSASKR